MDKLLVAVFPSEAQAALGYDALKDLHRTGDITMYASTIVTKDASGTAKVVDAHDRGPDGTLVGILGGALVGLIGGPAGVVVGTYVGGVSGLAYDLFRAGIGVDFVDEVAAQMTAGTSAIVADLDESWVTPVETALQPFGAVTFRRIPSDLVDEELNREAAATDAELAQLRAELRESNDKAKAAVRSEIEKQVAKVKKLDARLQKEMERLSKETAEYVTTLNAQRENADEQHKAHIDARLAEMKADREARQRKLQHSRELTKEALELAAEALKPTPIGVAS